jgi:hypothetical protein
MNIDQYIGKTGKPFQEFPNRGYTVVPVLHFLRGKMWDEVAIGYVQSLRPSYVRVITDGTIDLMAISWRVTVELSPSGGIRQITQEVQVGLPAGINCGHDLDQKLKTLP